VLAFFLDSHTPHYDLDDKRQLIWDMAEAMNLELRQLAASGCKVIQVEEPTLHFMARYYPEQKEFIDFLVDAFNREVEGLDDVEVWIHTCWGNPNMQKVFRRVLRQFDGDLPRTAQGRRLDDRSHGEQLPRAVPVRRLQELG
jgi:methionine synthase II (cobalamin-independent)